MSLNPRSIALQGIGSTTRLIAVQGLWPLADDNAGGGFRPRRVYLPRRLDDRFGRDDDDLLLAMTLAAGLGRLQ